MRLVLGVILGQRIGGLCGFVDLVSLGDVDVSSDLFHVLLEPRQRQIVRRIGALVLHVDVGSVLDQPHRQVLALVLDQLVQRTGAVDVLSVDIRSLVVGETNKTKKKKKTAIFLFFSHLFDQIKHGLSLSRLAGYHERCVARVFVAVVHRHAHLEHDFQVLHIIVLRVHHHHRRLHLV